MTPSKNQSSVPLRVLVIEDSENDTMLVLREIRKGGYEPVSRRVQTADEMRRALAEQQWDLIISDYSMPEFDGLSALSIAKESGLDIPFILVSGTITEETAVHSLKGGAHDFMTKYNLSRLVPAIDRELKEADVRRERRRMQKELEAYHAGLENTVKERTAELRSANEALMNEIGERKQTEKALRESEERLALALKAGELGSFDWDAGTNYNYWSDELLAMYGIRREEFGGRYKDWVECLVPDDREAGIAAVKRSLETGEFELEFRIRRRDNGEIRWVHGRGRVYFDTGGTPRRMIGVNVDITERKRAQAAMVHAKELSDAVNHINTLIFSTTDFDRIMQSVLAETAKTTGADAAVIYMPEGHLWTARYSHGLPGFDGKKFTADDIKYSVLAVKKRMPVIINDLAGNEDMCRIPVALGYWVKALLDTPLILRDDVIGNFSLYSCKEGPVFSEAHADFLNKVSVSVSLAMKNAELFNQSRKAEKKIQASRDFLNKVMQSVNNVIFVADLEGRIIEVNDAAYRITGYGPEELKGKHFSILLEENMLAPANEQFFNVAVNGKILFDYEARIVRKDGGVRYIIASAVPLTEDGNITGVVGAAQDITERKRMEDEIMHMAHHDALTGLPNRRLFTDILEVEIAQARRHKNKLAILFLDLDRFKEINDTLGHHLGDHLLKEVAARFRHTIRQSDSVGRIGGDEFNIVLADINRTDDIIDIVKKVIESLRKPIAIDGNELAITTSIGISVYPDDSDEIESLLRYADMAMYSAKEGGRNAYRFYNPDLNIRSRERMQFEQSLRQTLQRGGLSILYQPQIDIKTGNIVSAEALVRWLHPELGLLEPARFIPFAEENGFIGLIDEWVLETVCAQGRTWLDAGMSPVRLTVNLSARQFQNPGLVQIVVNALERTGMPADALDIEITESTAMSDIDRTVTHLRELARMGVHVSIDDFGSGYSSLNYLKRLPVEKLKIDKSFIQDIASDPGDRAIIHAVTTMAHIMKMKVLAEGVETQDQLSFLRGIDCDEAQGFFFSKPIPAEELREMVSGK